MTRTLTFAALAVALAAPSAFGQATTNRAGARPPAPPPPPGVRWPSVTRSSPTPPPTAVWPR